MRRRGIIRAPGRDRPDAHGDRGGRWDRQSYTVFACLTHTTTLDAIAQRTIVSAHRARNQMEYEAEDLVSEQLIESLTRATETLSRVVQEESPR